MEWLLAENIPASSLKLRHRQLITSAHTKVFYKILSKKCSEAFKQKRVFWIGRIIIKIFILN